MPLIKLGNIFSFRSIFFAHRASARLDTLVQSRTRSKLDNRQTVEVTGKGADIFDFNLLQNKAKRKTISQKLNLALIDVATEKGHKARVNSYWNAYYCQDTFIGHGDRLHANQCKTRFCTNCLAIRKAVNINNYYPVLSKWEDAYFVTLTVKSITARKLNKWIDGMLRAFKRIVERINKRHRRGKGIKLMGIRSLECNFNPIAKTYNPHFHIIVQSKEAAELLRIEWMQLWTTKHTYHKGQHYSKITNIERVMIEVIKYGSKIFTDPTMKKNNNKGTPLKIYAHALDNIFCAMENRRVFDRFGFNLPPKESKTSSTQLVANFQEWIFDPMQCDWMNTKTNERLTGYVMPHELEYLLNECMDAEVN